MNSLVGRKFYLTEAVKKDFPYPEDIRILEEDDDSIVYKKGSMKRMIDKVTLHRFYTAIVPDITFAIRYIVDTDLRRSLMITVNSYESDFKNGNLLTYFQCVDILGMYLRYMKSNNIEVVKEHNQNGNVSVINIALDQSNCIALPKDMKNANKGVHQEKRFLVYGYKEDNLIDLIKFIDRKKWLGILKNLAMSINSIYELGIDKSLFTTKSLLGFVKQIEKMSSPICHIMNIIPDTMFPENERGDNFIQCIYNMNKGIAEYPSMLKIFELYDHGKILCNQLIQSESNIDPISIRSLEYNQYINIHQLKIKNPKDNIVLVKTMKNNKIYVIIYRNKPMITKIVTDAITTENKQSALSLNELKTFLSKKSN